MYFSNVSAKCLKVSSEPLPWPTNMQKELGSNLSS